MLRAFHSRDACPLASLTACQGQGDIILFLSVTPRAGHRGLTHGPGLHRWVIIPALILHFYPETGLLTWRELALNSHCRPDRSWSPWEAFPSMWSTRFTLEMAKYYWHSTILCVTLILLWVFKRKPSGLSPPRAGAHLSRRMWGNTVASISLTATSDPAVCKHCFRDLKPVHLLWTPGILTNEILQRAPPWQSVLTVLSKTQINSRNGDDGCLHSGLLQARVTPRWSNSRRGQRFYFWMCDG